LRRNLLALTAAALLLAGCRQDMHDAPRYEPLEGSAFFADGRSSRVLLANTVARGQLREDDHLYTGKVDGQLANEFPTPVTAETMARGRERFDVFCSPCHGRTGEGNGMIVQRGFRQPPSFHEDRLVNAPVGYYFDVMTNGFGAMQDYAAQVPVADRWAIAAYLRALQLSRRATPADVRAENRAALDAAGDVAPPAMQPLGAPPAGPGQPGAPQSLAPAATTPPSGAAPAAGARPQENQ
jgi:mono/diheme cytochrome c family protein